MRFRNCVCGVYPRIKKFFDGSICVACGFMGCKSSPTIYAANREIAHHNWNTTISNIKFYSRKLS